MTDKTLEDELRAAFDTVESDDAPEGEEFTDESEDTIDPIEDTSEDVVEDDLASDISDALDVDDIEPQGEVAEADEGEAEPTQEPDTEHQAEVEAARAPNTWTPAAREHWADMPTTVQAEITKRENEIATTLTHTAQQRELAEAFESTIAPFKAVMAAEGATNPLEAIENTFNVVATLRMGNEPTKAAMVARLMQTYGVTVDSLADVLEGVQAQQPQQQAYSEQDVAQIVDQRLAQNQNQQVVQTVQAEMDTFKAGAEFFDDVRTEMATLAEVAKRKGESTSWQQLYDGAIAMRPDLQQIIAGRGAPAPTEPAPASKSDLRAKKAAAGSLPNRQGGAATTGAKLTSHEDFVRDAVEQLQ